MKRIALNLGSVYRCINKPQIKMRIVSDHDGPSATSFCNFTANRLEYFSQSFSFIYRIALRIINIDTGKF